MDKLRLVEPSVELLTGLPMLERIERAGRICYRSEKRIVEGSAEKFARMIIDRGHLSVLGHSQIYVMLGDDDAFDVLFNVPQQLASQFYSVPSDAGTVVCAGADAWLELFLNQFVMCGHYFLKEMPGIFYKLGQHEEFGELYTKEPMESEQQKPVFGNEDTMELTPGQAMWFLKETILITLDRAAAMQLRTHRLAAHSIMSQRYINFTKYGFPYILPDEVKEAGNDAMLHWYECKYSEIYNYEKWIELGFKPEIARTSLGSDIESTMVVTASLWEWKHILEMRLDPHAQPAIRKVAKMIYDKLLEKYGATELIEYLTIS